MRANINVVGITESCVTIQDIGPWDQYASVTNDVENVVEFLVREKVLKEGMKLFYYDSDGYLDEIVVSQGKFVRFQACN